jgi:hypothetical protein
MSNQTGTVIRRQQLKGNSAASMQFRIQLAKNLRFAMGTKQLAWTELADLTGLTRDRLNQVSTCAVTLNAIELTVIAAELGVSLDELTKGCVE